MGQRARSTTNPASGVTIRPEWAGDQGHIRALIDAAFGNVDGESLVVDRLRVSDRWIPELSLLAVDPLGRVVGHCVTSIGELIVASGNVRPILAFGPIGVAPDRQREGIGTALMAATVATASAAGWSAIVLLGHPTYYPRFGFEPARALGIMPQQPWMDSNWMVLRLPSWTADLRGTMRYPSAFGID